MSIVIRETNDWPSLRDLFIRYQLEYHEGDPLPEDTVKLWEAVDETGKLAGGGSLAYSDGRYVLNGIATELEYRGMGVGGRLLEEILAEVRSRNGDEIILIGKVPEFYLHYGFDVIPVAEVPDIFECTTCDQYQKTCFPEAMKKAL